MCGEDVGLDGLIIQVLPMSMVSGLTVSKDFFCRHTIIKRIDRSLVEINTRQELLIGNGNVKRNQLFELMAHSDSAYDRSRGTEREKEAE